MVNIEIEMRPYFWLSLFRRDVDVLVLLAEHHYDGACRAAGRQGGFLYGWFNITRDQSPCGEYKIEEVPKCNGTRRDLDTVLKICEGTRLAVSAKILTTEDAQRIDTLCSTIMTALDAATQAAQLQQIDPIKAPTTKGSLLWATNVGRM